MDSYDKKRKALMASDKSMNVKKRLKTGAFYTPENVAKEVIINAINDYYRVNTNRTYSYKDVLSLNILDPSCGSGVFLHQFLEVARDISLKEKIEPQEFSKDIVTFINNHLFGVDISKVALEKCKELIMLFIEQHQGDVSLCQLNLHHKDFLKMRALKKVQKFDLIIGNPPYIGEKNNSDLFRNIKNTAFGRKYYESKMDYFYFFIYKGHDFLMPNGILSFITTSYFFTADGAKNLRQFIKNNFNWLTVKDYGKAKIFSDAKISTVSYSLLKQQGAFELTYQSEEREPIVTDNHCYYGQHDYIKFLKPIEKDIINKIEAKCPNYLGDYFRINQGIVTGYDRNVIDKGISEGVFVLTEEELNEKGIDKNLSFVKPFYKSSSLKHRTIDFQEKYYILYIDALFENECEETRQLVLNHLLPYKERLSKRREVKSGVRLWYQITWPRDKAIFEADKILVPQRHSQMNFVYLNQSFYSSADIYYLTPIKRMTKENATLKKRDITSSGGYKIKDYEFDCEESSTSKEIVDGYKQWNYDMKCLRNWLNSSVMTFWYQHKGKKKGPLMEFYSTPLKIIPLPETSLYNEVKRSGCSWIDAFDFSDEEKAYIL